MVRRKTSTSLYIGLVFLILLVVWVVFSGMLDAFHLPLGVLSAALVTWLSSDLLFSDRSQSLSRRCGQAWRFAAYTAWLLVQVVKANLVMLKLAFSPPEALQPQIVIYRCGLKSDFEKFLLANSFTLTPGTVTMKILGDTYYVHAINDDAAAGLDGEMERRIARIFAEPGTADAPREIPAA